MDFPIRIYYEDTDAGGVVYHANYLKYFERARTEFLRCLGFSQSVFLEQKIAFVVKKIDIDYQKPAFLDDLLTVKTQISLLKKTSVVFEQKLYRNEECLTQATVLVVCVDLMKMKPVMMPSHILQALQAV